MAIDTAERRRSVAAFALVFVVPGVTPNVSKDLEWRQEAAWLYSGIEVSLESDPPEDRDDDISVTTRTDSDGATVRAARVRISHAADGERRADLDGFDRMPYADRFRAKSLRTGRTICEGAFFTVRMDTARAGEAWSVDRIVAKVSPRGSRSRAADTTTRTDTDGATHIVPTVVGFFAADDERNATLASTYGTVQDRWIARLPLPDSQRSGQRFRFRMETSGRAGESWAIDRLVARVETEMRSEWGKVT